MSGYDGYSKSNSAVEAEAAGRMTATQLSARLGCHSAAIPKFLCTSEYHHTSSHYNTTLYYDESLILAVADNDDIDDYEFDEEEIAKATSLLETLRAWKPAKRQRYTGCKVEYLTWSGSRKHPVATEHKYDYVDITVTGTFLIIHTPDRGDVRKKSTSNGTDFVLGEAN